MPNPSGTAQRRSLSGSCATWKTSLARGNCVRGGRMPSSIGPSTVSLSVRAPGGWYQSAAIGRCVLASGGLRSYHLLFLADGGIHTPTPLATPAQWPAALLGFPGLIICFAIACCCLLSARGPSLHLLSCLGCPRRFDPIVLAAASGLLEAPLVLARSTPGPARTAPSWPSLYFEHLWLSYLSGGLLN